MDYRIILMIFLILTSCKNNTKGKVKESEGYSTLTEHNNSKVIKEVETDKIEQWELRGIELSKMDELFGSDEIYKMIVVDHAETYSFVAVNNIKIGYTGGKYKISLIVKSNDEKSNFGMRIQEVYPTRFDVVFDLFNSEIYDTFKNGDFTDKEKLLIEPLEDGWYKCSIETEIYASYFRLLFGATNVIKVHTKSWESELLNDRNREILFIPSSLKIEELAN